MIVIVQDSDELVIFFEAHALSVCFDNLKPLAVVDGFTIRQSERVVPNGLRNVRTQKSDISKLACERFRIVPDHVRANQHTIEVAVVVLEGVLQHAAEAGPALDLLHPLHVSPSPSTTVMRVRRRASSCPRSWSSSGRSPELARLASWFRFAPIRVSSR